MNKISQKALDKAFEEEQANALESLHIELDDAEKTLQSFAYSLCREDEEELNAWITIVMGKVWRLYRAHKEK